MTKPCPPNILGIKKLVHLFNIFKGVEKCISSIDDLSLWINMLSMGLRHEFCTEKIILKYDLLISWAVSKKCE